MTIQHPFSLSTNYTNRPANCFISISGIFRRRITGSGGQTPLNAPLPAIIIDSKLFFYFTFGSKTGKIHLATLMKEDDEKGFQ